MSTKEEALEYIRSLGQEGSVSRTEVVAAYDSGAGVSSPVPVDALHKKTSMAELLYYIGGGIVVIGIAIFLGQNWEMLSFPTKVLATLGSGVAAYVVGVLFSRRESTEKVGAAFHLIGALVLPVGLWVVFENSGLNDNGSGIQTWMSAILFVVYLASYVLMRKTVLALFSVLFGTWLFFSVTSLMMGANAYANDFEFLEYRVLVAGITYMLLGYSFSKSSLAPLKGFLFGFGILGFLGAALVLGGWTPNQNVFWELIFPLLAFGTLFLGVHLRTTSFLTFGTLFLMAYIIKITSEYFSDSLGWPLALVIAGLGMIAVGFLSFKLRSKYMIRA